MSEIKVNVTTNAIYHALFRLLETKSFDEISVNDVCLESLVSRTTFYSYFEDKYELVMFCLHQERERLGVIRGIDVEKNLVSFLKRIKEKKLIYKNLLVSHINRELREMIAVQFYESVDYIVDESIVDDERSIIISLYTGGISFIIMGWISNDCVMDEVVIASTIWKQLSTTNK